MMDTVTNLVDAENEAIHAAERRIVQLHAEAWDIMLNLDMTGRHVAALLRPYTYGDPIELDRALERDRWRRRHAERRAELP